MRAWSSAWTTWKPTASRPSECSHSAQLSGSMSSGAGRARPAVLAAQRIPDATCAAK